jgi:hypothetical protein
LSDPSGTEPPSSLFVRALFGALAAGAASLAVGCATIWGFEDAVPLRTDGGSVEGGDADSAGEPAGCTCVSPAPDGWTGPFELGKSTGSPAGNPPPCGTTYPSEAFIGFASPSTTPASCACSCSAASGSCSGPVATVFGDGNCSRPCGTVTLGAACASLDPGTCGGGGGKGSGGGGGMSVTVTAPSPGPGACTPQPSADAGAPPWTASARLCGPATALPVGTCASDQRCAPAPDPGFETGTYCVSQAGHVTCPAGPYTVSHTYFATANDTRSCTGCACEPPVCPSVNLSTFTDMACMSASSKTTAPSGCIVASSALVSSVASTATCVARAGMVAGMFVPTSPSTLCCTN